jgi:hypothetical protein
LTRINCGFKVNSVLIWFLGDVETTWPLSARSANGYSYGHEPSLATGGLRAS